MLTFKAHAKPVHGLAFSPDGRLLATAAGDAVKLWDLDGPAEVGSLPGSEVAGPVAFSPDGRLVVRGGRRLAVWEVGSGNGLFGAAGFFESVGFAPDGSEVAGFGTDTPLVRWSPATGQRLPGGWGGSREANGGNRFPAGAMAYSPDGSIIATAYGVNAGRAFDSHVVLWERATGKPLGELTNEYAVSHPTAVAFSPDGSVLAGIYGPTLRAFDVASGKQLAAVKPGKKHFKGLAFLPRGDRLVTVNTDTSVRVYDTASWAEAGCYEWQVGRLTAVAVAADGLRAACGSDRGRVVVWDLDG